MGLILINFRVAPSPPKRFPHDLGSGAAFLNAEPLLGLARANLLAQFKLIFKTRDARPGMSSTFPVR